MPTFGPIAGAQPGDLFASRAELALLRQHRPLRAGVCAIIAEGAESLILADQYEDDDIHETYFWYAGHGSRDPKTGHQISHQTLTPRNRGLLRSEATGRPIRVFRRVAPAGPAQFRYEGLWRIVAHEYVRGKSGFLVYRFRLEPFGE
jgi:hypothetical protein